VLEILEAQHNRRPLSLDAPPVGEDSDDASGAEWVGRPDGNFDLVDDRLAMESVLPTLDEREREVLRLRFVEELRADGDRGADRLFADADLPPPAAFARPPARGGRRGPAAG